MKTDLKQLVDRDLSGLRWDAARQQRVLRALDQEGGTTMKRKLTLTLAIALALVLTASVALAAVVLNYSPEASAKKLATQAMYVTYGFDRSCLGLFKVDAEQTDEGVHVHYEACDFLPGDRVGEYDVLVADGQASITWTHDDKDAALWQSGDMDAPCWGVKQLQAYLAVDPLERGGWLDPWMTTATATVLPAATPDPALVTEWAPEDRIESDLTLAQAQAYADAALADMYGMTEAEVAGLDHDVQAGIVVGADGQRRWSITYSDAEGMYSVLMDASTGEIIDVDMSTGGLG